MTKMNLIASGRTAEVFSYSDDKIVKLFHTWCPRQWISKEAESSKVVSSAGLSVPRYFGEIEVEGRRGLIFERIEGESLFRQLEKNPFSTRHVGLILANTHYQIHSKSAGSLPSLMDYMKQSVEKVECLSPEKKQKILKLIESLKDGNALCHYDFHPGQIIQNNEGCYVIDWMTAFRGNPIGDVARTYILFLFGQLPPKSLLLNFAMTLVRKGLLHSYLKNYARLSGGINKSDLERWAVVTAATRLMENIEHERADLLRYIDRHLKKWD